MLHRSRFFQYVQKTKLGCALGSHYFYLMARCAVSVLFIYAGAVKLGDPRAFARTISGYGLLPEELLVPVAIGLPAVELIAGVGLLFNLKRSLSAVFGLVFIFLAVLGYAIVSDLNVDCGCFSKTELDARNSLRRAFYRDIGLMLTLAYLFFWERRKRNDLQAFADSKREDSGQ
jgi:uncharacterized membrane protein YphA (DoxX/SURF4 family)